MNMSSNYTETDRREIDGEIVLKMRALKQRGVSKPRVFRVGESPDLKSIWVEIGGPTEGNPRQAEVYQFSPRTFGFPSTRDFKNYVKRNMGYLNSQGL